MSQHERQDFIDKANGVIYGFGGVPDRDVLDRNVTHWKLETRLGLLRLHVDGDLNEFGIGIVYTRFDEAQRALCEVDCHSVLGKWNHYYISGWTVKEAIDDFTFWIRRVMT